ncbi:RNA polymerase sigma factor [Adlercreutzia sp. ZJ242]|uniref:RNA polymerase sigma factor n=1 Tax=Adlercreutzia sp. ZJ242 TaxID=2709409 RepID=UPI0019822635|nr:sigma-70 family RNA polymerase sigma factor [Adlercreutzia sp. ZJ242]
MGGKATDAKGIRDVQGLRSVHNTQRTQGSSSAHDARDMHGLSSARERKLIRDVQRRGSREAAEELVRAYYDEVYAFAFRQCGRKEDALDLTQGIFMATLHSLPRFDRRRASFRTWLYRIAAHKVIDARRRVRADVAPLGDADVPDGQDFAAQACDRMLLEQIESYVCALDAESQAVYRLRLYAEHTFPEIAEVLGMSESAVKARYYRLAARLRKEFGSHE